VAWPTWAFRPGAKPGNPPIPHRRAARLSIPASLQQLAREGGAGVLAGAKGDLIWGLGGGDEDGSNADTRSPV
jgi:hypothetical protein